MFKTQYVVLNYNNQINKNLIAKSYFININLIAKIYFNREMKIKLNYKRRPPARSSMINSS